LSTTMRTMMEALTRSPSTAEARLATRRMMTNGFARSRRIWTRPAVRGARAGSFGPTSPNLRRASSAVKPRRAAQSSASGASTGPCGTVTTAGEHRAGDPRFAARCRDALEFLRATHDAQTQSQQAVVEGHRLFLPQRSPWPGTRSGKDWADGLLCFPSLSTLLRVRTP